MQLLTDQLRSTLPPLYSQEDQPDPIVHAKFFDPTGSATWYVLEGGPVDGGSDYHFFTYVTGLMEDELGYTSLAELRRVRGRWGLGIERDLHWTACPLSEVRSGHRR